MASILLSIKPEYVNRILTGSKKYEFRKRLANRPIEKILIYSTAPIMQIVGEVQIAETISASPTALWELTKENAGITRDKFREYFKGCKTAYAYRLGQVTAYSPPKALSDFNLDQPPQSFRYILGEKTDGAASAAILLENNAI
ncbi:MAG: hypothetical protein PHI98_13350 [Eubacteriales bacterium]|nr:hypothetical protein [Eubacteriales bacterium]